MKFFVTALFLFAALNVTYRAVARQDSGLALLLSAVEKAEASEEFQGTDAFAKLKRCTCTLPGNTMTMTESGLEWDVKLQKNKSYATAKNGVNKTVVQGSEGYYSDCKFALFRKCNRAEIDFSCRQ